MKRAVSGKKSLKAMTLTEVAIVLGAMGLVIGAIWAVAASVWSNAQNQTLNQQVVSLVQNVRDYYANRGFIPAPGAITRCATNSDITAMLDDDDRRLIPIEMRASSQTEGGTILHAFGGQVRSFCLDNGRAFSVRLSSLDKESCVRLLIQFPFLVPELGVKAVQASGSGGKKTIDLTTYESNPSSFLPMKLSTATSWCSQEDENEVTFDFKLHN